MAEEEQVLSCPDSASLRALARHEGLVGWVPGTYCKAAGRGRRTRKAGHVMTAQDGGADRPGVSLLEEAVTDRTGSQAHASWRLPVVRL